MSSLMEPSSIVLLIGAFFILLFILHGLWFSNKPQTRKLNKNNQQDVNLRKSKNVGKVRIVSPDLPDEDGLEDFDDTEGLTINRYANQGHDGNKGRSRNRLSISEIEEGIEDVQPTASIHVNKSTKRKRNNPLGIEEINLNDFNMQQSGMNMGNYQGIDDLNLNMRQANNNLAQDIGNLGGVGGNNLSEAKRTGYYDLVLVAPSDRPYKGSEIEEICNKYGFIQGFVEQHSKIFFVYENVNQREDEVFRICSLKPPYYFPEDMSDYTTNGLVLYMTLPAPGKGYSYFKALCAGAQIIIRDLGGQLQDNNQRIIDESRLRELADSLIEYDQSAAGMANNMNNGMPNNGMSPHAMGRR